MSTTTDTHSRPVTAKLTELSGLRDALPDDPTRALAEAQAWLSQNGTHPEALRIAASAHRLLGQDKLAQSAEIAAIQCSQDIPALARATELLGDRQYSAASALAASHLQNFSEDLKAMAISAESAIGLGLPDKAIPLLETVVARAPAYLLARALLINALSLDDRLADARKVLDPIVRRLPEDPKFQELLGKIASQQGDFETAISAYQATTRLKPDAVEGWTNLGDNLRFTGRKSEALHAYRHALTIDPAHGMAWWSLAEVAPEQLSEADLGAIRDALQTASDPVHACNLEFALGIAEDNRGKVSQAFGHFARGNALRKEDDPFDNDGFSALLLRHLDAFPVQSIEPRPDVEADGPVPIFIIGMPRSGSTLFERSLGLHPAVEALGELAIIPHMVERLRRGKGEDQLAQTIADLPNAELEDMGRWYVARAAERMQLPGAAFFTDKMHMNWRHLPLILRMLPQARIIDIRRNAMDCCWSNFRTLFARGHAAAHDLEDIGRFYRNYVRFVDTIADRAPGRITMLGYENLVADMTGEMGRICQVLGLELDPAMLDFHRSEMPVATASSEQVRQPLNRRGIEAWRPYREWLDPLAETLGPLADG